ncbi:universal stress protein [Wenzhouxiangella sp. XN201]|uniref:universal stress protein n=1 Tax=Wenzhouxiangella sp. XN201 TaxID=2710755 RepID=UPI0013CD21C7|nr:universal stress protein [Wenzhouxiangella sp. XN201]NEZ02994.1 universal stress protein [Wenzhouxiangella sp. XN201]
MEQKPENSPLDELAPTRVVVLVDASPDALHALEAGADLARRHDVPLLAVSVEEPDRVRSAAYSFAREIGAVSGSIRPLYEAQLTRRRQRAPATIRRAIEQVADARNLAWELVVLHGRLVDEVLALSEPGDFLVLGRVGWSARLGRKLGRASLTLAREAGGTVYICSAAPASERGRIAVLVESVDSGRTMIGLSVERARMAGRELVVLLAPSAGAHGTERLADAFGDAVPRWRSRALPALGTGDLLRALAEERVVELVVRRGDGWLGSPGGRRLLERLPLTVVVTN